MEHENFVWTFLDAARGECSTDDIGKPRPHKTNVVGNQGSSGAENNGLVVPEGPETPEERDARHSLELAQITPELVGKAIGDLKSGRLSTSAALALAARANAARASQERTKAAEGPNWNAATFEAIRATSFPWLSPDRLSYQDADAASEPPLALPPREEPILPPPDTWKPVDPFSVAAAAAAGREAGSKLD